MRLTATLLGAFLLAAQGRTIVAQLLTHQITRDGAEAEKPRQLRTRGRVPCEEVISQVTHNVSLHKGQSISLPALARQLGTTKVWAAHCMLAYGRRVPAAVEGSAEEDDLEKLEDEEPEETGPEDVEEPGAKEQREDRAENPQDRREEHVDNPLKPSLEKEQVLRLRPESTGEKDFSNK